MVLQFRDSTLHNVNDLIMLCEQHEDLIADFLGLRLKPQIYYGEKASEKIKEYGKHLGNPDKLNGAFLYKDIPALNQSTGIICITKPSIATLAHEMMHAKQFQDGSKWLDINGGYKKLFYKYGGYNLYPSEVSAYRAATKYCRSAKMYKEYRRYLKESFVANMILLEIQFFVIIMITLFIIFKF